MQALKTNIDFFDIVFSQFRDHQWFQVFLIVEQNSLTIIDVVLFAMSWTSPHICKKIRLPSYAKAIAILISIGMLCFMCVFFCSRLEPTTLINEQNVSYINFVCCQNIFSKKLPKSWFFMYLTTFSYLGMLWTFDAMSHVTNSWCHVTCCELLIPCQQIPWKTTLRSSYSNVVQQLLVANVITCAITRCMAIIKTRATDILCYAHSLCVIREKKERKW